MSRRFPTVLSGLLCAAAFAVALNVGTVNAWREGRLAFATVAPSVDDQYYAALIADGAWGHWNLGHASLKEHRDDPASSTYAPLPQSALMRLAGWSITKTLIAGDVFFPFLIAFLLFLGSRAFIGSSLAAAATALLLMVDTNVGWLRSVTPQMTFVIVAAYLAVILGMARSRVQYTLRGGFVGLMLFTHVIHASFFLIVEAVDAMHRFVQFPSDRPVWFRRVIAYAIPFLILLAGKIILHIEAPDAIARADTFRRLGMIQSHLPAAPVLQVVVIGALVLLWHQRRRLAPAPRASIEIIMVLLLAGIVGLHQSVLHGRDLIFGLYYAPILRMILWLALTLLFVSIAGRMMRISASWIIIVATLTVTGARSLAAEELVAQAAPSSQASTVAAWFALQPSGQVVLAPYEIGNLLPVLAGQYVVFNKYALYQNVRDEELVERYVLQQTFFPTSAEERGEGYNSVFGLYAGNSTARERTFCHLRRTLMRSMESCDFPVRAGVYHQELLRALDRALIDPPKGDDLRNLLRTFHVDWIVSPHPIPQTFVRLCPWERVVEGYELYRCRW